MKKKVLIIASFLLLAVAAKAQDDNRERFQIGIKAGASLANVYDAQGDDFDADPKLGFNGGVFFTIPLGTFIGLQPEVLITQKGFRAGGTLLGESYGFKRTTTFLEIPILVAIKPAEFITVVVGPQYSYLLHQKDVFTNSLFSYSQEQEFKQDNIRKNIFGVVAGIDFNIHNFVIGTRIGIDVTRNRGDGTSNTPRYRNVSGQLTLGYKFL